MKKIEKSIKINAPKEKVWEVLVNNNLNALWYAPFGEGTHTDTDWQTGSKALFIDKGGSGLASKVIVNRPFSALSIEHQGVVTKNVEDYDGEIAQLVKGGLESYYLTESNGVTSLAIESDMSPEYFDMMSSAWDEALQIISRLAKNQ